MNIFLVGFMGSGKSTLGKILAKKLDYRFVDLDQYIEEKTQTTIPSIFRSQGENVFRRLEEKVLAEISTGENSVIATGGGTPCHSDNMDLMNRSGKTVYLNVCVENLLKRLLDKKEHRPLIAGKNREELRTYITVKLEERAVYYNQAQYIFKGDEADVEELIGLLFP